MTVTGAGGVGKTRVALQVATALAEVFPGGAWLVELAALNNSALIVTQIARTFGIDVSGAEPLEALGERLNGRTLLLVLDNCEHLIAGVASVAETLVRRCANLQILATSREPLRIAGERSYRLPSLRLPSVEAPRGQAAADLSEYAAVRLFAERARAVEDRFVLTDQTAPLVAQICRRLDGIPLAIELAAARIGVLSLNALLQRLDQRFHILTGGLRTSMPRHQTMRALIDWSYDLLAPPEQRLFEQLCVFAGGCTLAAASAVCTGEDVDDESVFSLLGSLVGKSLIIADLEAAEPRYRLAESARAYARDKVIARGGLGTLMMRHLRYLRDVFAAARARADSNGAETEIVALLITELDHVRVTLDGVADNVALRTGAELLAAIDQAWLAIGLDGEGSARLERFASLLSDDERRLKAQLWSRFADIARFSEPDRALGSAAMAVRFARNVDDGEVLARALNAYARNLARVRAFDDAAAALAEAEALSPAQNVPLRLRITESRAFLQYLLGDLDGAAQGYELLRNTHSKLGHASEADRAAVNIAENRHLRGQTERAIALVREVLPALRAGRDRQTLSQALANLCGYLVVLDRLSEARAIAREALQNRSQHDRDQRLIAHTIEHTALALALDGDVRRSAQLAGYTEVALRRLGCLREYTESTTRTRLEALLHQRLGLADREVLFAAGAALSAEAAIALATTGVAE